MVHIAMMKDSTLKTVAEFFENGWPNSTKMIPADVEPFFNRKESLYMVDSCIM